MRHPSLTIIVNRGASAYAPENTLAAFDKALNMTKGPSAADGSLGSARKAMATPIINCRSHTLDARADKSG